MSGTADVIYFPGFRITVEVPKTLHQIIRMNIVPDLFSLVAKDSIWSTGHRAADQIRQKTMELSSRMCGAGKAAAAENTGTHPEVSSIFLNHYVGGDLAHPKNAVFGLIYAH